MAAWHERQLCLVGISTGIGLLHGVTGEIDALYPAVWVM